MKNLLVCIPVWLLLAASALGQASETGVKDYRLVWSDEFNVDGSPDAARWSPENGFVRNQELQWYQWDNAFCRDGYLVLEARRDTLPNPRYQAGNTRDWKRSREQIYYTSASITTRNSALWTYGRFEVRARINGQLGSWPAIWLLGVDRPWPANGEIDVMEYYHVKNVPTLLANVAHADKNNGAKWDTSMTSLAHFQEKDPRWLSQFHLWRMDWTPESIRLFLDDELLNETDITQTINPDGHNPFHDPHYLLLNLAIGGASGGDPTNSDFPLRYEIDYVRVYQ